LGEDSVGPLGGVAPHSHEIFLDEGAGGGGTQVPANNPIDFGVFVLCSVFTALAYLEHPQRSFLVVVEVLSVLASAGTDLS
jgi:hypothetical protein